MANLTLRWVVTEKKPCAQRTAPLPVEAVFISWVLTYMATLEHLCATDKLVKHEPDLDDHELPGRIAYFAPEFDDWLYATLCPLAALRGAHLTPFEQAEQLLYEFVVGRPMAYDVHYKKLEPLTKHVWSLKTRDVRLFGWFAQRATVVLVCGSLKENVKRFKQYAPYVDQVVAFRDALDLDPPKEVTGVLHHEVL